MRSTRKVVLPPSFSICWRHEYEIPPCSETSVRSIPSWDEFMRRLNKMSGELYFLEGGRVTPLLSVRIEYVEELNRHPTARPKPSTRSHKEML